MFKANPPITKQTILDYISQEDIMERYLGVIVTYNNYFCSPLRKDENPTCSFKWINGTLYFKDWSWDGVMDCFNIVEHIYGVRFHDALKIIAKDFDLIHNVKVGNYKKRTVSDYEKKVPDKSSINVKVQAFTKDNIEYLKSYHLSYELTKKYNVFSPEYVWLNGKIIYKYDKNDPALAYYFGVDKKGNEKWKIYFYQRDENRFICNTNRINGWIQIPKTGDQLIITKSLKDVMCFDLFDIPAIAMQAESQTPYDYIIEELKERYTSIITIFDYDQAGIRRAEVIEEKYDIPYFFIQDEHAKDFSDYIKYYGLWKSEKLINNTLDGIIKTN